MSTKQKKSLLQKKLEAILVVHDMRLFEKKKIFASKKNDFWLKITNTKPITSKNQNLKKKKNCVLVCFFCMTVKQKNERKIFAPHYKNGLNKKKLIIKNFEKKMQSFFLIFMPTLNYCISLSMNEKKRYAMNPPPWKKIGYAQVCSKFPEKKKIVEKPGPNFSYFWG